jgi:hypothetical protein
VKQSAARHWLNVAVERRKAGVSFAKKDARAKACCSRESGGDARTRNLEDQRLPALHALAPFASGMFETPGRIAPRDAPAHPQMTSR